MLLPLSPLLLPPPLPALLLLLQVLFYARLLGDILGRMVPPAWQLRSSKSVLTAAFFKTKLLVVLVPAILQPSLVGGDLPLAALVACNWWLSGYINTGAYLLAPRLATGEEAGQQGLLAGSGFGGKGTGWRGIWGFRRRARLAQTGKDHALPGRGGGGRGGGSGGGRALSGVGATALRSKAGAVMSFCFQASCFVGLLGAWVIQEILHESGHPAFEGAGKAAGLAAAAAAAMKAAGRQVAGASTAAGAAAGGPGVDSAAAGSRGGLMGAAAAAFAAAAAAVTRSSVAPAAQEAL